MVLIQKKVLLKEDDTYQEIVIPQRMIMTLVAPNKK